MAKTGKMSDFMKREQNLAYKLLLPTLLIIFLIALYPLGQVFYISMTNKQFARHQDKVEFVGLRNYIDLLSLKVMVLPEGKDSNEILPRERGNFYRELKVVNAFGGRFVVGAKHPSFYKSIYNTLVFTVVAVLLETLIGLFIALVVNMKFRGQGAMRAVMLVPWAVITVVSAKIWDFMFLSSRQGFFNSLFSRLGWSDGNVSFLTTADLQMPALIAVDVWKTAPFMALLLLAGLQLIPQDMYKAADVDGASTIRKFFSITLPLLKPSMAVALIFRTLDSLRVFDLFQVLLANTRYSMATFNYHTLISSKEMGLASAVGVFMFFLIAIAAVSYIKVLGVTTGE